MRRIWENKESRLVAIGAIMLVLCVAMCVANIVVLNVFALAVSLTIMVMLCFGLGYAYSRYEEHRAKQKTANELVKNAEPNVAAEDLTKL